MPFLYFLNVLYNFGFPRGALWSRPPWRFWFSQCPMGPKFSRRCSAALRRAAPSARRTALVSRPHNSHLRARTARRTHPERAARTESGRAPPSGPERCNRTIAAPDGDLRPLLPRRCTPRLGCRNAVRRRTSTTVLTKQTKPSVPDRGIQLKG